MITRTSTRTSRVVHRFDGGNAPVDAPDTVAVEEERQGADLNRDGDLDDPIVFVYDADRRWLANTGLVGNQAFASDELETKVLEIAQRIAETPPAVVTVNKRYVYASLEARGAHSSIRQAADLQAGPHMQALADDAAALSAKLKAAHKKA